MIFESRLKLLKFMKNNPNIVHDYAIVWFTQYLATDKPF